MPLPTTQVEPISKKTADHIQLKLTLETPIGQLGHLKQALLFAEIALVAYLKPEEFEKAVARIGFTQVQGFKFFDSQAHWISNEHDSVVVFRDIEATNRQQLLNAMHGELVMAETEGRVHSTFKKRVDGLWPQVEQAMKLDRRCLWFAGHCIGGALAFISAYRCLMSALQNEPAAVFTYGSPRVGNRSYVSQTELKHHRWVNGRDFVPYLPANWMGYRHEGEAHIINKSGELHTMTGWNLHSDGFRGMCKSIKLLQGRHFHDHLISSYVNAIARHALKQ
ncbi:MAG TPA: lipase family protein [Pirellulaceae bacterium]|nr:lipase family protein [Pirellulaceae bacterium]HMO92353.1 lipase family protein [Pirellulaceae bacterium]HMP69277.1 lipase family protein [Pirellulaceae bacterium]